jgi:hypothetical protein
MTQNQEKLYWRLWGRVCHANDWRWVKGRILQTAERKLSEHHAAVWKCAEALARANQRGVTADDLRHGCHMYAIGRDRPHLELKPAVECSRVFTLFKLLIEPEDLDAVMDWQNPERDERRRLVVGIQRMAPFAYIDAICRDKFRNYTSPFFEDLDLDQLRHLRVTLASRARRKGVSRMAPACAEPTAGREQPF